MLREILLPWDSQPHEAPAVAWGNPITEGLVGLVWMGPGGPRDLVSQPFALDTAGVSLTARAAGVASVVTSPGNTGVYSPRNDYGAWKPASVPLTFAGYFDHTTATSSRPIAGTMSDSLGYAIWDVYGSRTRYVSVSVGGTTRTSESGTWSTGAKVRAMTVTDTSLTGYDDGKSFGTTTFASATALAYNETYGRLYMLGSPDNASVAGEAYWMAIWNRALTLAEHQRLAAEPWCLFSAQRIWVPIPSAGGTTYDVSLTESLSLADAGAALAAFAAQHAEAVSASDALSAAASMASAITEDSSAADAATSTSALSAAMSEAASASESVTTGASASASISEAASASDAASVLMTLAAAVPESLSVADLTSATAALVAAVHEAASVSELIATGPIASASVEEVASATDVLAAAASLVAQVAEAATAGDLQSAAQQMLALITEPAAAADQVAGSAPATYSVTLSEVAAAVDLIAASLSGDITSRYIVRAAPISRVVAGRSGTRIVRPA